MSQINKKWIEGVGLPEGFATLDEFGKLTYSQLPIDTMEYKGTWNASTNSPTLANGVGSNGDIYQVSVAGSVNFGAGSIEFEVGDKAVYNGSVWEKWDMTESAIPTGQVRYVNTAGSDVTGDGTIKKPFATITAAQNSILDAAPSKRYAILVAPGNYTDAIALKANVFIVGQGQKESVRITGAISMGNSFTANSSFDNRSGFAKVTLLSAADFNWNTVQSAAGKLYMSEVQFGSTTNLYGYNNAIAQAQFNSCVFFSTLTISGINVGVFTNNVCFSNINLNQHPNGGMATILTATGGYCSGTITQTTSVDDFNRRCASFLRSFPSEALIVDGPSSYADFTLDSASKAGAQSLNGGNLIAMNPYISHDITTQMIVPKNTNSHNMGDWGKQWTWNFGYVHASTGTDLYLISYPASYAPDSAGKSIGIYTDGAGLQENVNGGEIEIATSTTTGTGIRGKITLNGREIDVTSKQIKKLADGTDDKDAINKSQLDAALSGIVKAQWEKQKIIIAAEDITNGYIDLTKLSLDKSIIAFVNRLAIHETVDYTLSVVAGKTRITFAGEIAVGGVSELEVGDIIWISYQYQ